MPAFGNWYLATFWLVLVRLANIMAILLGLLALLKVISWTFGLVLRCVAVREVLGCGLGMLAACFLAWFTVGRAREVMGDWWNRQLLDSVANAKIWSVIDLSSGFWNQTLDEESRPEEVDRLPDDSEEGRESI